MDTTEKRKRIVEALERLHRLVLDDEDGQYLHLDVGVLGTAEIQLSAEEFRRRFAGRAVHSYHHMGGVHLSIRDHGVTWVTVISPKDEGIAEKVIL